MKSLLVRWGSAVRLFDVDESTAASRARFRRSAFICRSDFRRNKKVWRETKANNLILSYVSINTNCFACILVTAHKLISNLRYRACSNHCRVVVTVQLLPGSRRLLCVVTCLNLGIKRLVQLWDGAWKLGDCCDSTIIVTAAEPED